MKQLIINFIFGIAVCILSIWLIASAMWRLRCNEIAHQIIDAKINKKQLILQHSDMNFFAVNQKEITECVDHIWEEMQNKTAEQKQAQEALNELTK